MTAETQALIPELDAEYLAEKGCRYTIVPENGTINLIIHDFSFPPLYRPDRADLLIQLPAGYPNANPDMFWTSPDVMRSGGGWPLSSEVHQTLCGRNWQRWSRHFPANTWRLGTDSLQTYLAAIRTELKKGI